MGTNRIEAEYKLNHSFKNSHTHFWQCSEAFFSSQLAKKSTDMISNKVVLKKYRVLLKKFLHSLIWAREIFQRNFKACW